MSGGTTTTIEFFVWLSETMGGICSRSANEDKVFAKVDENIVNHHSNNSKSGKHVQSSLQGDVTTIAPQIRERMEKDLQEHGEIRDINSRNSTSDFYDGIPRYNDAFPHKSRSVKSRQAAVAKVGFL